MLSVPKMYMKLMKWFKYKVYNFDTIVLILKKKPLSYSLHVCFES